MKMRHSLFLAVGCILSLQLWASFSPEELMHRSIERRAIEVAIWGMPLVNFDAIRQAYFRDAGAQYNDVVYLSKPANWKFQTPTPNNSTNYAMFFTNLKKGPVVVEIPPTDEAVLFGSFIDAWNVPLVDVGNGGEDKGRGGKYLLIPPDFKSEIPAGYYPVYSSTYNLYGLLRIISKSQSPEDMQKAIAYFKTLKVHPLEQENSAKFIDISDKPFDGIAPYDLRFYTMLARMIAEEPVDEHDVAMMGVLNTIGIGKETRFKPNAQTQKILQQSIKEAHDFLANGFRFYGYLWWPDHRWAFVASKEAIQSKLTFFYNKNLLVNDRAFIFFATYGLPYNPSTNLYLKTHEDQNGFPLNGSFVYKLHLPAHVPTTQFWSVVVYDADTAGFIRNVPVVGLDSYSSTLQKNTDGSIDLYFAPVPPKGQEHNWISTQEGKPFFIMFRNYGPDKSVINNKASWELEDLNKVK